MARLALMSQKVALSLFERGRDLNPLFSLRHLAVLSGVRQVLDHTLEKHPGDQGLLVVLMSVFV